MNPQDDGFQVFLRLIQSPEFFWRGISILLAIYIAIWLKKRINICVDAVTTWFGFPPKSPP